MNFTFVRRTVKQDGTDGNMCIAMNNANTFGVSSTGTPIYLQYEAVANHLKALGLEAEKGVNFTIPGEWNVVPLVWTDREGNKVEAMASDGTPLQTVEPA